MPPGKFSIPAEAVPFTDAMREMMRSGIAAWLPRAENPLLSLVSGAGFVSDNEPDLWRQRTALVATIEDVVDAQMQGEFRHRMMALLGLGEWSNQPLQVRQTYVGESYPSSSRNWEGFRKEPLDRHLVALYIALEGRRHMENPEGQLDQNDDGYEVVQYHTRCVLETGETSQRRTIRALRDGVSVWETATTTWGRGDESVILLGPGTLTRHSEGAIQRSNPGKAYFLRVDLPKPLQRGDEYEFTIVRREEPRIEALPPGWRSERHLAPRLPVRRATFEIVFSSDRRPRNIWAFENLADWLVPGVVDAGTDLGLDADGVARYSWANPARRRACGIGWEW